MVKKNYNEFNVLAAAKPSYFGNFWLEMFTDKSLVTKLKVSFKI